MPNNALSSGRIADSLVEWHLPGEDQACLVPTSDWPLRALIRDSYQPYHDREILQAEAETVTTILATIDAQGPLSSLEFEDKTRYERGSWYGLTKTKRVLRALWACGMLVTHHRRSGRHYYDRPERVIPAQHYHAPPLLDRDAYHRWILARRFQAAGLLRFTAEQSIWSACGAGPVRKQALTQLIENGTLTPVHVGEKSEKAWPYYMLTNALPLLDAQPLPPRIIFLGPLDSFLWDRKAVQHLFAFDYTWEVYKPIQQRKWGYYILPVLYGDRFVARLDSRLDGNSWTIMRWWWEPDVKVNAELLDALRCAMRQFLYYLRANGVRVDDGIDEATRKHLLVAS